MKTVRPSMKYLSIGIKALFLHPSQPMKEKTVREAIEESKKTAKLNVDKEYQRVCQKIAESDGKNKVSISFDAKPSEALKQRLVDEGCTVEEKVSDQYNQTTYELIVSWKVD